MQKGLIAILLLGLLACGDKDADNDDDWGLGDGSGESGGDAGGDAGGDPGGDDGGSGGETGGTGGDDTGKATPSDACELYEANAACPECADGEVTCTYGDYSVTEMSCGGCQAEASLYALLCEAGVTDSAEEILAGMECSKTDYAACSLAEEYAICDGCADGHVTCTYGEHSETAMSCGDCQARGQLYATLCAYFVTDSREEIVAGTECSDPV